MVLTMIRQGRLVRYSKAQQRPRVSKLRAKGLSGCHPSGQQPRQPEDQIKNYSHDNLLKETELKAALTGSTGRAKRQPAKEAQQLKKWKTLTLCSSLEVAEGSDVGGDEVDDDWKPEEPITNPCDSITVSNL
jgi:hypothetical protein